MLHQTLLPIFLVNLLWPVVSALTLRDISPVLTVVPDPKNVLHTPGWRNQENIAINWTYANVDVSHTAVKVSIAFDNGTLISTLCDSVPVNQVKCEFQVPSNLPVYPAAYLFHLQLFSGDFANDGTFIPSSNTPLTTSTSAKYWIYGPRETEPFLPFVSYTVAGWSSEESEVAYHATRAEPGSDVWFWFGWKSSTLASQDVPFTFTVTDTEKNVVIRDNSSMRQLNFTSLGWEFRFTAPDVPSPTFQTLDAKYIIKIEWPAGSNVFRTFPLEVGYETRETTVRRGYRAPEGTPMLSQQSAYAGSRLKIPVSASIPVNHVRRNLTGTMALLDYATINQTLPSADQKNLNVNLGTVNLTIREANQEWQEAHYWGLFEWDIPNNLDGYYRIAFTLDGYIGDTTAYSPWTKINPFSFETTIPALPAGDLIPGTPLQVDWTYKSQPAEPGSLGRIMPVERQNVNIRILPGCDEATWKVIPSKVCALTEGSCSIDIPDNCLTGTYQLALQIEGQGEQQILKEFNVTNPERAFISIHFFPSTGAFSPGDSMIVYVRASYGIGGIQLKNTVTGSIENLQCQSTGFFNEQIQFTCTLPSEITHVGPYILTATYSSPVSSEIRSRGYPSTSEATSLWFFLVPSPDPSTTQTIPVFPKPGDTITTDIVTLNWTFINPSPDYFEYQSSFYDPGGDRIPIGGLRGNYHILITNGSAVNEDIGSSQSIGAAICFGVDDSHPAYLPNYPGLQISCSLSFPVEDWFSSFESLSLAFTLDDGNRAWIDSESAMEPVKTFTVGPFTDITILPGYDIQDAKFYPGYSDGDYDKFAPEFRVTDNWTREKGTFRLNIARFTSGEEDDHLPTGVQMLPYQIAWNASMVDVFSGQHYPACFNETIDRSSVLKYEVECEFEIKGKIPTGLYEARVTYKVHDGEERIVSSPMLSRIINVMTINGEGTSNTTTGGTGGTSAALALNGQYMSIGAAVVLGWVMLVFS